MFTLLVTCTLLNGGAFCWLAWFADFDPDTTPMDHILVIVLLGIMHALLVCVSLVAIGILFAR